MKMHHAIESAKLRFAKRNSSTSLSKEDRKKQKKIAAEIDRLRRKNKGSKYQVKLPDLSVEQNVSPLGNAFAPVSGKKLPPKGANLYAIGNLHKSNSILITAGMVANNELQWLSGKKS